MRRLVTLPGFLAILGAAAACNPFASSAPELTDPHEILSRTIETTAGLRTMRVRIDLEVRDSVNSGPAQGGSVEGAIDLTTGEMSFTGAAKDGSGAFGYIAAGGSTFITSSNGRWTKVPVGGGGVAAFFLVGGGGRPQLLNPAQVMADVLDDADTSVELRSVENCATGRCYVTIVALPPAQFWKLVVGLTGIDQLMSGQPIQQPQGFPGLTLQVLTDTATLRLAELQGSASAPPTSVAVRLKVGAPNEPVAIEAPPPALVDDMGASFGIGGGGVVAPAPAPAQPLPVESVAP